MKNIFFISFFLIFSIVVVSCNKDVKSSEGSEITEEVIDSIVVVDEVAEPIVEEVVKEKVKPKKKKVTQPTGPGIPLFSGDEAKKYVREYERYVRNYKKAVEAKDMESFLNLNKASSSLSRQYNSLISKLPPEEIQKLSDYMQIKSKQLNKLSEQM